MNGTLTRTAVPIFYAALEHLLRGNPHLASDSLVAALKDGRIDPDTQDGLSAMRVANYIEQDMIGQARRTLLEWLGRDAFSAIHNNAEDEAKAI